MPNTMDKLNRAKSAKNNEYYTRYEEMEWFFNEDFIKEYFHDKVVYLPCDGEQSKILKYLRDHKEELKIKEILNTSDDYYGHLDLYERADLIFTNPPFTKILKWMRFLNEKINKKFIVFGPWSNFWSTFPEEMTPGLNILKNTKYCFDTPEGENLGQVRAVYLTNILNIPLRLGHNLQTLEEIYTLEELLDKNEIFKAEDGNYCIKRCFKYPKDFYEEIYIPITSYIYRTPYFEMIKKDDVKCPDGKWRPRVLVKRIK